MIMMMNWYNIVKSNAHNECIEIDRSILGTIQSDDIRSIQLHGFADASQYAYGAAV